ncbi:MAG: thiamine diphosphokinase [Clostridiales bacterium]|nr:thiamine diphosphokinase [Clostridiales bacterium]
MKTSKRAVIFGSAPCKDWGFLTRYLQGGEWVIAADGGRRQAQAAGLTPDRYVGDGDSGGWPEGLESVVLPEEKDVTDLEAAISLAFRLGCDELLLTGCTGGRFDHYLSNCCLLEQIHDRGGRGLLVDEMNEIRYLTAGRTVVRSDPPYRYLGLLPLDRVLKNVSIHGTKYVLDGVDVPRGGTLTVSNEILPGGPAELSIGAGCALLVRSVPQF